MQTLIAKIAGSVVAVALFVGVAVPAASALTSAEIVALLVTAGVDAEVAAILAADLGTSSSSSSASCTTYTRDLTIGSQGADVVALQDMLVMKGNLVIPAGVSKGYFGTLTQSALASYQAANGISPASGYFGPITRGSIKCEVSTETGSSNNSSSSLSGGEASLEDFDISSGDDDEIEEGMSAEIAEIEFDVEDADVELQRLDLALVATGTSQEEDDPWDTFESLRLLVDGKEIAEVDLDSKGDYLDEDDGEVRIKGINHVFKEGKTAKIVVEITAQNSVDGADTPEGAEWTVNVVEDGIRAIDAAGIDQYIVDSTEATDTITFDVVEEGDGEELKVSSSKNDPESTTLKVEDDKKSDEYTIFTFELEAEDNDIDISTVTINVDTLTADIDDVVDEFILVIDGEEFDDWDYVSGIIGTDHDIEFDIDEDFTLDEDDEIEISLVVKFNAANDSNYASTGETISANVVAGAVEGEGADDIDSTGVASGDTHNLEVAGIIVDESGFSDEGSDKNNDDNTSRDFEFTFEVTAFEEDFYVATSSITTFLNGGTASTTVTVDSSGDEDTDGVFTVEEGSTETFTVIVTVSNVSTTGQYRVGLDSVDYTENSDGVTDTTTKDVENQDFRTAYSTINS